MPRALTVELTERDVAFLIDLYKYRYLSTPQIATLHFPSDRTAWRRLSKLAGGQWITHLEKGLIRRATSPTFTLTADVKGAVTPVRAYNAHAAYVVESILVDRFSTISVSDVIGAATLDLQIPYNVGLYIPSGGITASQAIQQILSPLQAFLGYTERGLYHLRALRLGTSAGTINEHEIQKMKRLESTPPPVEILKMSWGHNWTVRKDDQLALERSDEFAAFSIQEDRFATAEESGVSSVLKEREIMTLLTDEADAISEATRQIALMASSDIYEVTITQRVLSFVPGDTVKIIYDAFGFDNGQLMLVLSARENGRAGTTVFRVWGGFI